MSLCAEIFLNIIIIISHASHDTQTKIGIGIGIGITIAIISTFEAILMVKILVLI
jgi:hypothetical protein